MKKLWMIAALGLAAAALIALTVSTEVGAQVKQGKSRPAKTKHLMKGLVAANCGALKKGLDAGPASDEQWEAVAIQASLLNEAGHALMADGRCPDGDWAGAAKTLQDCSAAVLKAIDAKDAEGAKSAFGEMTKACAACHKAHKK